MSCGDARPTKSAPDALGRASVPARLAEPSAPTKFSHTPPGGMRLCFVGWPAERVETQNLASLRALLAQGGNLCVGARPPKHAAFLVGQAYPLA